MARRPKPVSLWAHFGFGSVSEGLDKVYIKKRQACKCILHDLGIGNPNFHYDTAYNAVQPVQGVKNSFHGAFNFIINKPDIEQNFQTIFKNTGLAVVHFGTGGGSGISGVFAALKAAKIAGCAVIRVYIDELVFHKLRGKYGRRVINTAFQLSILTKYTKLFDDSDLTIELIDMETACAITNAGAGNYGAFNELMSTIDVLITNCDKDPNTEFKWMELVADPLFCCRTFGYGSCYTQEVAAQTVATIVDTASNLKPFFNTANLVEHPNQSGPTTEWHDPVLLVAGPPTKIEPAVAYMNNTKGNWDRAYLYGLPHVKNEKVHIVGIYPVDRLQWDKVCIDKGEFIDTILKDYFAHKESSPYYQILDQMLRRHNIKTMEDLQNLIDDCLK